MTGTGWVLDVAMPAAYFNTIGVLTSTLLLFWFMRACKRMLRCLNIRASLINGTLVNVRGLGSYLSYFEDATPSHANSIIHTRQIVEPAKDVKTLYNPFTIEGVKVRKNIETGKLEFKVKINAFVPLKILILTNFEIDVFKKCVESEVFAYDNEERRGILSGLSGLSSPGSSKNRSRSRSKSFGSSSNHGDDKRGEKPLWVRTLMSDFGQSLPGTLSTTNTSNIKTASSSILERSDVCTFTSNLSDVSPGEQEVDLETAFPVIEQIRIQPPLAEFASIATSLHGSMHSPSNHMNGSSGIYSNSSNTNSAPLEVDALEAGTRGGGRGHHVPISEHMRSNGYLTSMGSMGAGRMLLGAFNGNDYARHYHYDGDQNDSRGNNSQKETQVETPKYVDFAVLVIPSSEIPVSISQKIQQDAAKGNTANSSSDGNGDHIGNSSSNTMDDDGLDGLPANKNKWAKPRNTSGGVLSRGLQGGLDLFKGSLFNMNSSNDRRGGGSSPRTNPNNNLKGEKVPASSPRRVGQLGGQETPSTASIGIANDDIYLAGTDPGEAVDMESMAMQDFGILHLQGPIDFFDPNKTPSQPTSTITTTATTTTEGGSASDGEKGGGGKDDGEKESSQDSKENKDSVALNALEFLIGTEGTIFSALEIFGYDASSTSFLKSTVMADKEAVVKDVDREILPRNDDDLGSLEDDCMICMDAEKSILLLPCRHMCCCDNCLPNIHKCPVCRAEFEEYISVNKAAGRKLNTIPLSAKKNQ